MLTAPTIRVSSNSPEVHVLVKLPRVAQRVVVGDHALLDLAQTRRQIVLGAKRAVPVGRLPRLHRKRPIRQEQVFLLQYWLAASSVHAPAIRRPFTKRSWAVPKNRLCALADVPGGVTVLLTLLDGSTRNSRL